MRRLLRPRALVLVLALAAGATSGASLRQAAATDIEELRERAQAVADELSGLEHDLAGLEGRKARLEKELDAANQEIGALELEIRDAETALAAAHATYVQRAVDAYKAGPGADLEILLSATSIADLDARAQASSVRAKLGKTALDELLETRAEAEAAQDRIDARKQRILRATAEIAEVTESMSSKLEARREVLGDLSAQIEELEEQARREAREEAARAAAREAITSFAPGSAQYEAGLDESFIELVSPRRPTRGIPDGWVGTGVSFEGIASWYGPGFEGNLTASGDIFDSDLFTVASKELPLGTWLYVEHEGVGVVVLVNDRGPYVGDRILDLSRAAAEAIGISGLGWVKAEIVLKA